MIHVLYIIIISRMNFFFPTRTGKKGDEMKNKQTHNFVQRGNKNRLDLVQPNPRRFLTAIHHFHVQTTTTNTHTKILKNNKTRLRQKHMIQKENANLSSYSDLLRTYSRMYLSFALRCISGFIFPVVGSVPKGLRKRRI